MRLDWKRNFRMFRSPAARGMATRKAKIGWSAWSLNATCPATSVLLACGNEGLRVGAVVVLFHVDPCLEDIIPVQLKIHVPIVVDKSRQKLRHLPQLSRELGKVWLWNELQGLTTAFLPLPLSISLCSTEDDILQGLALRRRIPNAEDIFPTPLSGASWAAIEVAHHLSHGSPLQKLARLPAVCKSLLFACVRHLSCKHNLNVQLFQHTGQSGHEIRNAVLDPTCGRHGHDAHLTQARGHAEDLDGRPLVRLEQRGVRGAVDGLGAREAVALLQTRRRK
mmetsp:Transcript_17440/g.43609  ORF Transcript_17440/g.43609 Transcript_17440/m.43609 type:complete len:279 (+) Transcript_17440:14-850(+)